MKLFISKQNSKLKKILSILFWLVVWQMTSQIVHQELLISSPILVLKTLASLIFEISFWKTVFYSVFRITSGFLLANLFGIILAILSYRFATIRFLLNPLISFVKSTPVASFVILVILWFGSKNLSIVISFLMVFPIIYTNTLQGIVNVNQQLVEMAKVFRIPFLSKFIYIYMHEVLPFYYSGCLIALGLCWKSGVAAELIGIPSGSIGERLYEAKIYLNSAELFAWTFVIILLSISFEKLYLRLLAYIKTGIENSV
jgi:NitT/TauT family transport system permease protein